MTVVDESKDNMKIYNNKTVSLNYGFENFNDSGKAESLKKGAILWLFSELAGTKKKFSTFSPFCFNLFTYLFCSFLQL